MAGEWTRAQRRAFIWRKLSLAGRVNKRDLMQEFGLSSAVASYAFTDFNKTHPGAMTYDISAKFYRPGDRFEAEQPEPPPPERDEVTHWRQRAEAAEAEITHLRRTINAVSAALSQGGRGDG